MRPTWAEVSLAALRHNYRAIQQHVGAATVCAVIKADAYGHGVIACARALEEEGASWFGVTNTEEGVRLRQAGIRARILLMTGFWRGEQQDVVEHRLTPAIWEWWQVGALEAVLNKADAAPRSFPVHVKVDTGMARLGVPDFYMGLFLKRMKAAPALRLEGLFSHMASAEVLDARDADEQVRRFEEFREFAREQGMEPECCHLANSASIAARPALRYDMVRPGIALYGYMLPLSRGGQSQPAVLPLQPVLSWKTRIITLKDVGEGQAVGYNGTFVTTRPSKLGILPVGYADGLCRMLSSPGSPERADFARSGRMIVRGQYVPVVGRVAMDITTLDVTDVPGVSLGDEVTILGRQGDCTVDAWEHARLESTIPYEVLCRIGARVRREYT
jgi:alanine racemase